MIRYRLVGCAAAVAAVLHVSTAAFAQTTHGERAYRGVFGAATQGADIRHNLEFTATLAEAYDDDVYAELRPALDPAVAPTSGYSAMVLPALVYSWRGRRVEVAGSAASSVRYYPDLDQARSMTHDASLGLRAMLAKDTSVEINQSGSYSPMYLYRLFPVAADVPLGGQPPGGAEYGLNRSESYSYQTSLTATRPAGRRGTIQAESDIELTHFLHQVRPMPDMRTMRVSGEYSYSISDNVDLLGRYEFRDGDFTVGVATTATQHSVDMGFSYTNRMSSTRSASFELRLGASAMQFGGVVVEDFPSWNRQFQGELNAAYDFGRTWQARAALRRGAEFVPTLPQPVFADSVTLTVDGLATRRFETQVSAAYSTGESALSRNALTYDTYAGAVRLRFAVTSTVAPYVEYLYYFYDFRGSVRALTAGVPDRFERNGVRVGLALWIPLMRR